MDTLTKLIAIVQVHNFELNKATSTGSAILLMAVDDGWCTAVLQPWHDQLEVRQQGAIRDCELIL